MTMHPGWARTLILLCLLALQTQLLASSAMGCEHSRAPNGQTGDDCFHVGDSMPWGADGTDAMLDCQKCVLGLFFGVYHPMVPASSVGRASISPVEAGSGFTHYYLYVPDRLYRPPISLPT